VLEKTHYQAIWREHAPAGRGHCWSAGDSRPGEAEKADTKEKRCQRLVRLSRSIDLT
jgi:hypothetical protein